MQPSLASESRVCTTAAHKSMRACLVRSIRRLQYIRTLKCGAYINRVFAPHHTIGVHIREQIAAPGPAGLRLVRKILTFGEGFTRLR